VLLGEGEAVGQPCVAQCKHQEKPLDYSHGKKGQSMIAFSSKCWRVHVTTSDIGTILFFNECRFCVLF
jgi:hypothetical protein